MVWGMFVTIPKEWLTNVVCDINFLWFCCRLLHVHPHAQTVANLHAELVIGCSCTWYYVIGHKSPSKLSRLTCYNCMFFKFMFFIFIIFAVSKYYQFCYSSWTVTDGQLCTHVLIKSLSDVLTAPIICLLMLRFMLVCEKLHGCFPLVLVLGSGSVCPQNVLGDINECEVIRFPNFLWGAQTFSSSLSCC